MPRAATRENLQIASPFITETQKHKNTKTQKPTNIAKSNALFERHNRVGCVIPENKPCIFGGKNLI